jgi:zinc protease
MVLDRSISPDFQEVSAIRLPSAQQICLDNGLLLCVVNVGQQPVLRLDLVFEAGNWYETHPGVSFFTTKMLNEGTQHRSSTEISTFFDQYGAFTEFFHGPDRAGISIYSLSKHLPTLLPVVQELLSEASFPEQEWHNLQRTSLQNLQVNLEKTAYVATQTLKRQLFGATHPYGRSLSEADIKAVDIPALSAFYEQSLRRRPFRVFMSGQITDVEIRAVADVLGSITLEPPLPATAPALPLNSGAKTTLVERESSVQSSIRMGMRLINRSHPDYFRVLVVNEILGGYFGSRLMKNIREEKGLTYGISSNLVALAHEGYFVIGTDVKKENTQQTIDEIRKEILTLQTQLVDEQELTTVKNFMSGEFAGSVNTPFEIAERHKVIALDGLPSDFYQHYISTVRSVTSTDVLQLANKYFDLNALEEVVVGGK